MRRLIALTAALVLVAACESSRSLTDSPTEPATVPPTFPLTDTTPSIPNTQSPVTVGDTTATTESEVCAPDGDVDAKGDADPLTLSGMIGMDIRTGSHPCYERIVIELDGTGDFPGWNVAYVDDPVRLGESDDFVEITGVATLSVRMGMWMTTLEGGGYQGEIDIFPTDVTHILELRETENSEGMCIWSIGLDAQYPFSASIFHDPERLVIDVQVPAGP